MVKNLKGELLLYNSLSTSLGKVTVENADTFMNYFKGVNTDDRPGLSLQYSALAKIREMGFIVPEYEDEDLKLRLFDNSNSNTIKLTILPTEQCNFRCPYCYEEFKRGKMSNEIQNSLVKFIKKNIGYYTNLSISWFGGEPLVALDVITNLSEKFMQLCKRSKRIYIANMTTNGYLLTLPTFKKLLDCNILTYQITIDGLRETHNRQKPLVNGGETFDTVINNLLEIKNTVKTGKFEIMIRTNITKEIYNDVDNYINYFNERFGDDERFTFLLRPAGDWGGDSVKSYKDQLIGEDDTLKLYDRFIKSEKSFRFMNNRFLSVGGSICYAADINSLVVDAEGNIRKCTCSLEDMENNKIGELQNNGDIKYNNYKRAQWLVKYKKNDKCNNCFFLPACQMRSCPAQIVIRNQNEYTCPYEKNSIDQTLQLMDKNNQFIIIC